MCQCIFFRINPCVSKHHAFHLHCATDKLPIFDEIVDISYGLYDELLNLLRDKQINVQKAMSTLLPQINSNVLLPNDIANLTRKVKKTHRCR